MNLSPLILKQRSYLMCFVLADVDMAPAEYISHWLLVAQFLFYILEMVFKIIMHISQFLHQTPTFAMNIEGVVWWCDHHYILLLHHHRAEVELAVGG